MLVALQNKQISLYIVDLRKQTELFIDQALAPSTAKAYKRSVNLFRTFSSSLGKTVQQCLKRKYVELWLTQLASKDLQHNTIKSHLSALRHHCIRHNIPHSLHSPRLHLLLKGLARCSTKTPTSAAAVSTKHLRSLARVSKALHSSKDHCQPMAMMAVAFYGFLRPSGYCVTPSAHYLKWNDVQFSNKERFVRLTFRSYKHSKAKSIIQLQSEKTCCPIYWLKQYRKMFASCHSTPLFDMTANRFKVILSNLTDAAKIKTNLTPHSFRHGGASWASQQGWPDARIKAHGRWRSDAYKRYVRAF